MYLIDKRASVCNWPIHSTNASPQSLVALVLDLVCRPGQPTVGLNNFYLDVLAVLEGKKDKPAKFVAPPLGILAGNWGGSGLFAETLPLCRYWGEIRRLGFGAIFTTLLPLELHAFPTKKSDRK
ncbi:hypothetical protein PG984_000482 [Apiospora sp. TS-2023a]